MINQWNSLCSWTGSKWVASIQTPDTAWGKPGAVHPLMSLKSPAQSMARIACVLSLPALLHAAEPQARLSVEDCVRIALERNERLRVSESGKRAAAQRRREAATALRPNADLHAGASYAPLDGYDPALTEGGEYSALVEVQQRLYDAGVTRDGVRRAEIGIEAAEAEYARDAADLRLDVRLAYIDVLDAERRRASTEDSIRDLHSYLETVRSLANGGVAPKSDVLKGEIQEQGEAVLLEDEVTAVENARLHLIETLGLPWDTAIAIRDTVDLPSPRGVAPDSSNAELQRTQLDVRAAELDLRVAHAERAPNITLQGSAGAWTSRAQLEETSAPHWLGYMAGISVEMPILDWGAIASRIDQQSANLGARRSEYRILQRQLEAEYQGDVLEHATALRKLARLEANYRRALDQYRLIQSQYAGGGSSGLEVLDAHRSVLEISQQLQEVRAERERLQARLLRLTGEPR